MEIEISVQSSGEEITGSDSQGSNITQLGIVTVEPEELSI